MKTHITQTLYNNPFAIDTRLQTNFFHILNYAYAFTYCDGYTTTGCLTATLYTL